MFDIGFSELIVVALVALIVIGPERLPRVARTLGALLGRAQRYVNDVKSDIQREVNLDELKDLKSTFQDAAKSVEDSVNEVGKELQATGDSLNKSISGAGESTPEPTTEALPADGDSDTHAASPQLDLALESKSAADPATASKA
ncbi:MAG: twin-arginine translocase subunit TatB [Burkholderiales bacterium]|nr:twin-arginine translocase subunit TatB [Burkholderiales bacterium]